MEDRTPFENIIAYMCITIIVLAVLLYFIISDTIEVERKQNRINELQNTVEQQIELIDALQQR